MDIGKKHFPAVKKISLFLVVLLMGMIFPVANPQASSKEAEILLLHSNNVTGYLFPCPT
jgi:hypothetical protein